MKKAGIVIAFIVGLFLILSIGAYNSLVRKQENVAKTWSLVENVCQRRADLVPNLVALVKDYTDYEAGTIIAVTEARDKAAAALVDRDALDENQIAAFDAAQERLGATMNRLIVEAENYPDLKANEEYLTLQTQLAGCENRIQTERERFNKAGKAYNESIRHFPSNLIAKLFGFEKWPYFEAITENADRVPETF